MLKSISGVTLLVGALAMAVAFADEPAKSCPGGACGAGVCAKAEGTACSGCPAAAGQAQACATCPDQKKCGVDGKCAEGTCATACSSDCQDCPVTAAMKALPQITYAVGETKTNCPKQAAEVAKTANAAIQYVVCEKNFGTEAEANAALADATEQFVAEFAEPKKCEESGKVKVCGKDLCCETMAAQTATVAKTAMEKVAMTYLVGEKECSCPNQAASLAKESGNPTVFVVAGETTCCNVQARLNLARAKYKAAVVALMQSETQTAEKTTSNKDS